MGDSVAINTKVKGYTSRVLGVVKEKYGLRDKGEALDKFAEMFGDEFVEQEASEAYAKKILKITEEHYRKHPNRRMSDKELDELCGL
ncbi:MAG: DUF2683 family protein [Candidatus Diapherotrites archaeon]|nr:DUF2683 family protein [Candidatus Diapherotrites archaeon]